MRTVADSLRTWIYQRGFDAAMGAPIGDGASVVLVNKLKAHMGACSFSPRFGLRISKLFLVGVTAGQSKLVVEDVLVSGSLLYRLGYAMYQKAVNDFISGVMSHHAARDSAVDGLSPDTANSATSRLIRQQEHISGSMRTAICGDGVFKGLVARATASDDADSYKRTRSIGGHRVRADRLSGAKNQVNETSLDSHGISCGDSADNRNSVSVELQSNSIAPVGFIRSRSSGNLAGHNSRPYCIRARNWFVLRSLSTARDTHGHVGSKSGRSSQRTAAFHIRAWIGKPVFGSLGFVHSEGRAS